MARISGVALALAPLVYAMGAAAQTVPVKTISFYNNSNTDTLYPVLQVPIMNGRNVHDLWLQAQLNVKDLGTQIFNTTVLYKIYVNRTTGIPPHHSVTLTVPFYTQLLPGSGSNLGTVNDQFIDWWNAMRIFIFDGVDAVNAAYNYSVNRAGDVVPPAPVTPLAGAAVPTCSSDNMVCEPLRIVSYVNGFPSSVPAQLVEYTFAAAEGPPLNPKLSINTKIVNFNISAVDQIYLPAAIGAHGNATADNTYLGSTERMVESPTGLRTFAANGASWPVYVPAYYTAANPIAPLSKPPAGQKAYPLPQVASSNVMYAESFKTPPPAPPVLSSDTLAGIGKLGTTGQATLNLWTKCTTGQGASPTCKQIKEVNRFFVDDYHQCFPQHQLPSTQEFLRDVYGWVQFPGCPTPLSLAAGYKTAIQIYCNLQYNFFNPKVPASEVFNPYVSLVHKALASNAYAFSIDDAVSFKSIPGDGIIVTVAGENGLENTTQTPLPTATTYQSFCRGS